MRETKAKNKLRVALYIRVSTDEQADKYGSDLQRSALVALVNSKPNDFVLAGEPYIYLDEGVSGTVMLDERPEFSRLKEDILMAPEGERPFDAVAVYKIDRFARRLKILLDVIDFFDEYGVQFISANESIDTSTPFGKAMLGIVGIIAELERDTIIKRTRDGIWEAFDEGVALGNAAPYGYTKDERKRYAELPAEADIVRQIFSMFVDDGMSIDAIAKYLYEHKIYSPVVSSIHHKKRKGNVRKKNDPYFWTLGTVRRILSEEIYVGRIYGNKTKGGKPTDKSERRLSKTPAPLVVDLLTFERAQRILASSLHRQRKSKDDHVYILGGLLKCDCCYDLEKDADNGRVGWHGEVKDLKRSGGRTHYYKCGRKNQSKTTRLCNSLPLSADELEKYVVDYSRKLLSNPVAVFSHQKQLQSRLKTIEHLRNKDKRLLDLITAIPKRRKLLSQQHEMGLIKTPALKEAMVRTDDDYERYKTERNEVQVQIAQHTLSKGYIKALGIFSEKYRTALDAAFSDRNTLRSVLHGLIEEIVVYTRPVQEKDLIAGRKKHGQQIPHRIHIKLKLPSDILSRIGNQGEYLTDKEIDPASKGSSGSKSIARGR